MNSYQSLYRKFLGIAFIAGPLLFVMAAVYLVITINRFGTDVEAFGPQGYLEGILMSFAVILFIPIYLELARLLGQHSPRYGLLCAVSGLFGMAASVLPATARIWQLTFLRAGINEEVWDLLGTTPEIMPIALFGLLAPLTSLLLGIGLLRVPSYSRWTAVSLIVAGISFLMAQVTGTDALFILLVFYPLATVAWLVALAPMGWRYLTDRADPQIVQTEVAID